MPRLPAGLQTGKWSRSTRPVPREGGPLGDYWLTPSQGRVRVLGLCLPLPGGTVSGATGAAGPLRGLTLGGAGWLGLSLPPPRAISGTGGGG